MNIKYNFGDCLLDVAFLMILLIMSVTAVYVRKPQHNLNKEVSISYMWGWGSVLFLASLFGYLDHDFYFIRMLLERSLRTNSAGHVEPVFEWIFDIYEDYYFFRFVVWGLSTVLLLLTLKNFRVSYKTTFFFLTVFYALSFYKMRGSLGTSLLFFGISYLFKVFRHPNKLLQYITAFTLIIVSFFFHKSMGIAMAAMVLAYFIPLNRKTVVISLALFPVFTGLIPVLIEQIPGMDLGTQELQLAVNSAQGYSSEEQREFNLTGQIRFFITYAPMYWGLVILTKRVIFKKIKLPTSIHYLYKYWYVMFYISTLFYGQDLSTWIFIRFITMALFPMAVVMGYYYRHYRVTLGMKMLASLAIIANLLDVFYPIYERFIK